MAHSKMEEKLDGITHGDLGVPFDEGFVWEKLESRLEGQPKAIHFRWMIATAIFLGVFFIPYTILKKDVRPNTIDPIVDQIVAGEQPKMMKSAEVVISKINSTTKVEIELLEVKSKKIEMKVAGISIPTFSKIVVDQPSKKRIKPQFAVEDISVIQASLEDATINDQRIERGKKLSISAQWNSGNSSSDRLSAERNQALTIRFLDAKTKSQK